MKVNVYSRAAATALIKKDFPKNVSVISFYTPSSNGGVGELSKVRVDYSSVCDDVFYVGVPDIAEEGFIDYGYTTDTFLSEIEDLVDFIYKAYNSGRDIICQCDFGWSRSAACAAAILERFYGRGDEILLSDNYHPNITVYTKVSEALRKRINKGEAHGT